MTDRPSLDQPDGDDEAAEALVSAAEASRFDEDLDGEAPRWDAVRSEVEAAGGGEALLLRCDVGRALDRSALGDHVAAAEVAAATAGRAAALGERVTEADARSILAWETGIGDPDAGLRQADDAMALLDEIDDDPEPLGYDDALRVDVVRAVALSRRAHLQFETGRPDAGEDDYHEARRLYGELGAEVRLARVDLQYGSDLLQLGRVDEAIGRLEAARSVFRGDSVDGARAALTLAQALGSTGDLDGALREAALARTVFDRVDDQRSAAFASLVEGQCLLLAERPAEGVDRLEAGVDAAEAAGEQVLAGRSRQQLGLALGGLGRVSEAVSVFEHSVTQLLAVDDGEGAGLSLRYLSSTHRGAGDYDQAAAAADRAAIVFAEAGLHEAGAASLGEAGEVLLAAGRPVDALERLGRARVLFEALGDRQLAAVSQRGWALAAAAVGRDDADAALGRARRMFAEVRLPWPDEQDA